MLYTNPVGDDPSHSDTIQVGVKTLTGKTMTLDILPVATVHELMLTIQNSEGIPADQQRLIFRGKSLHYRRNLADVSDTCSMPSVCANTHSTVLSQVASSTLS